MQYIFKRNIKSQRLKKSTQTLAKSLSIFICFDRGYLILYSCSINLFFGGFIQFCLPSIPSSLWCVHSPSVFTLHSFRLQLFKIQVTFVLIEQVHVLAQILCDNSEEFFDGTGHGQLRDEFFCCALAFELGLVEIAVTSADGRCSWQWRLMHTGLQNSDGT